MLALLFAFLPVNVLSISQYDEVSNSIIAQQVSKWYADFDEALHLKPVDQEQIYKLWTRGLVLNYHQKYERDITENMFINAYKFICNNTRIIKRMVVNPKNGVPNPFQTLYRRSTEALQKELYPLAMKGKWDVTLLQKRQKQAHIATNQETLRLLRDNFAKYVSTKLPLIPSVLRASKEYFRNLSLSSPSWTQIEIAITTFRLSIQTLPLSMHYYPEIAEYYLTDIAQYMALITICNLKQAEKIMNIISDQAPELTKSFMAKRQQLVDEAAVSLNNSIKIQADDAEILVARLRSIAVITFYQKQLQIIGIFESANIYLKKQARRNETSLTVERYQFCIALFKEVMFYSKAVDNFYNNRYMIDAQYLKSMVKSIAKIVPIDPDISVLISSVFHGTYPELEREFYVNEDDDEFFIDFL